MKTIPLLGFLLITLGFRAAIPSLSSAQTLRDASTPSLEDAVLELAESRQLQLAYAPELLAQKQSGCAELPVDTMAAFACILQGTGLEVEATAGDVYVIYAPSLTSSNQTRLSSGTIAGAIFTASGGKPIAGAHIQITDTDNGDASGPDGRYAITHVPPGHYGVVVSMVGFQSRWIDDVNVRPGQTVIVDAVLDEATLPLNELVVTSHPENTPGRIDLGPVSIGAQDVQIGPVSAGILVSARPESVRGVQVSGIGSMVRDSLEGIQISGIFNTAVHPSHGVQVGGIFNMIDGSLEGVQLSSIMNGLNDGLIGVQLAGVANLANGSVLGVQGSATLNLATGMATGVQLAGMLNIAGDRVLGVQGAGMLNNSGDLVGLQASGIGNFARSTRGLQVSGIANVAAGELVGAQISLLNVAGPTRGVQIGLVNFAESLDGLPLGLVSYVREFGLRYDVLADETGTVSTVLRSGNRRFANYLGFSARPAGIASSASAIVGFGISLVDGRRFHHTIDALIQGTGGDQEPVEQRIQLRALVGFKLLPHIDIVAGPTLNLLVDSNAATRLPIPWRLASGDRGRFSFTLWPGMALGLRLSTRG